MQYKRGFILVHTKLHTMKYLNVYAIEAPACLYIIKSIQIRPYSNSYKLRNDERRGMRAGSSLRVGSIIMTIIINKVVQSNTLLCVFHKVYL